MASTTDFKNGLCIEYNNNLYTIVQFQHVKPGKGPAFVRTKLKNLTTGKVIDNTFNSGVKINIARIERRQYQYLYKDDMGYNLMNLEDYEQISLQEDLFDSPQLMKDGQEIDVVFHADTETPLYTELPPFVVLEVTYTEPGLKGDTSSSSSNAVKIFVLETITLMVN